MENKIKELDADIKAFNDKLKNEREKNLMETSISLEEYLTLTNQPLLTSDKSKKEYLDVFFNEECDYLSESFRKVVSKKHTTFNRFKFTIESNKYVSIGLFPYFTKNDEFEHHPTYPLIEVEEDDVKGWIVRWARIDALNFSMTAYLDKYRIPKWIINLHDTLKDIQEDILFKNKVYELNERKEEYEWQLDTFKFTPTAQK